MMKRQTSGATATVVTTNNAAAGTTNQVVLSNNSSYYFRGQIVARQKGSESTTATKAWEFSGVIRRGVNAAATALVAAVTPTVMAADASTSAWTLTVDADTTNGCLRITATGEAAKNIQWVGVVTTVESIYA